MTLNGLRHSLATLFCYVWKTSDFTPSPLVWSSVWRLPYLSLNKCLQPKKKVAWVVGQPITGCIPGTSLSEVWGWTWEMTLSLTNKKRLLLLQLQTPRWQPCLWEECCWGPPPPWPRHRCPPRSGPGPSTPLGWREAAAGGHPSLGTWSLFSDQMASLELELPTGQLTPQLTGNS